jgi:FkbM family methyltransferase
LDIGANIGYYAIQESKLVGEGGVVWAVEPVEKNVELLNANLKLNHCDNVLIWKGAVGDRNCTGSINISPMRNMGTLKRKENFRGYLGTQAVEVKTLDNLLLNRISPDVIRMDVEGYELEILQGGGNVLKNGHSKLFIEVHFDVLRENILKIVELLKNYGYDIEVATFEPHYSTREIGWARDVTRWLDRQMGAESTYLNLKIDDLREKRFVTGQVEDLEIVFSKKE